MLRQMFRHLAWQVLATRVDLADYLDDLFEWRALQKIAANSGRERALNLNIPFEGREHDDPGVREICPNQGNGADSAHVGEPQIHQRDIRLVFFEFFDGFHGRSRHSNELHVLLMVDDGRNACAEARMVVDTQYANGRELAHLASPRKRSLASQPTKPLDAAGSKAAAAGTIRSISVPASVAL